MEAVSGIFRVSTSTGGENLRVMRVRHSFSTHGVQESAGCKQAWKTMKVTTLRRNMDCLLFGGAKTTASCMVQWTSESVAIGRMDDAQITIGTRDPGRSAGTFPPAFPLPMLASEIWSQQALLAILHDLLPCAFFASPG